jgi:tetratricopeptide (TPR) repeat protein
LKHHQFLWGAIAFAFIWAADLSAQKKRSGSAAANAPRQEVEFLFTEGQKHFILEDYSKALLYFQQAADLQPTSAAIHFKLAEVLAKKQNGEDLRRAAAEIEWALRLERKNKFYYVQAAEIYGSLLEFKKAQQVLEELIKEVPGTEEYLYNLAAFYLYDNQPNEAIRIYNRIESVVGVEETTSTQKQRIFLEQGRTNEAIAEAEKLLAAFPDEEKFLLDYVQLLAQSKNVPRAVELLRTYLRDHQTSSNARFLLAGLLRDNGQMEESQELLWQNFDDPTADVSSKVLVLGTYNSVLGNQAAAGKQDAATVAFARKLAERLLELHPEEVQAYIVTADLELLLRNQTRAAALYAAAIQRGATNFEVWQNLLLLESQSSSSDSLVLHAEQGLELFPNQPELYYFLGYGHFLKKRHRLAAQALEQGKKLASGNPALQKEMNALLGDTYNALQEFARSDQAFEAVLQTDPGNAIVLNNYAYYLALRKQNLEKAEKMSTQLIKDNPDNPAFLDTHGWVLFMRDKHKEAKRFLEKAIALDATSAVYYEHLGDILYKLGETQEAVQQWQKAQTMDANNETLRKKILDKKLY